MIVCLNVIINNIVIFIIIIININIIYLFIFVMSYLSVSGKRIALNFIPTN